MDENGFKGIDWMKWDNTDKNACWCVKVEQYCKLAALSVEKVDELLKPLMERWNGSIWIDVVKSCDEK